jgi:segregation and condensation protein A
MYTVKTKVFEGPLDLLLQLISRQQIDVAAVSLNDLVEDYLEVLAAMERLDLDVTSEFLLIAATLVQLKAHRLLPRGEEVDLDDELLLMEERDRLLARLLSCVTFKDVAAVLARRLQEGSRWVPRTAGLDQPIPPRPPTTPLEITAQQLAALAVNVMTGPSHEVDLDHLELDLPSVERALDELAARVTGEAAYTFDRLVEHCERPVEVVAYFLALLELARWGMLELKQTDWMSTIEVRRREGSG